MNIAIPAVGFLAIIAIVIAAFHYLTPKKPTVLDILEGCSTGLRLTNGNRLVQMLADNPNLLRAWLERCVMKST